MEEITYEEAKKAQELLIKYFRKKTDEYASYEEILRYKANWQLLLALEDEYLRF